MQGLMAFVMRGRMQALTAIIGLAIMSLLIPPVSLFSSASLALVALRKGARESAWVLSFAVLGVGLAGVLLTGNALQPILYGLLLWLPVWPVAVVLRESRRLDWAMETALGLGLASVLGIYLMLDDPVAVWRERLQAFVQPMLENAAADFDAVALAQALDLLSHYFTGVMAGASVMSVALGLLIARWQQAVLFNPGGFRSEFVTFRLRAWVVYAGLSCIALGLLGSGLAAEIAWNLNGVFLMLFILGGFAILHARLGGKGFWVAGVYLALLFIPQLLLPLIALLGLSDQWLDWRGLSKRVGQI